MTFLFLRIWYFQVPSWVFGEAPSISQDNYPQQLIFFFPCHLFFKQHQKRIEGRSSQGVAEAQVFLPKWYLLLVVVVSTPESITLDPTMHLKGASNASITQRRLISGCLGKGMKEYLYIYIYGWFRSFLDSLSTSHFNGWCGALSGLESCKDKKDTPSFT